MNAERQTESKKFIKIQNLIFWIFAVFPFIIRASIGLIWVESVREKIKDETRRQIAWQSDFPDSYFNQAKMTEEYRLKNIWLYKDFLTIYVVPEIEYHSTRSLLQN